MTQVDWPRFVGTINSAIGRSPTRELDASNMPSGTPASFIAALGEFQNKGTHPTNALRDNLQLQKHMSFGFFVACDRETLHQILIAGEDFQVLLAEPGRMKEHFIITGTLYTWRVAITKGCQEDSPVESREFFNHMWILFDKFGFRDVFGTHRRKDLKDKTFMLEQRR